MSDSFIEFTIEKKVRGGLILRADEERGFFGAFIHESQISQPIMAKIASNEICNLQLKARFLSDSSAGQFPVYTQRNDYKAGEVYPFRVTAETTDKYFVCGEDDYEYRVNKTSWERGPKYKSLEIGSMIECRVKSTVDGYPDLEQVNLVNPYYIEVEKLISNRSVVRNTFQSWIDNPSEEQKVQLKRDYEERNANWVFTYASLLKEHIYTVLESYDYNDAEAVIKSALELETWIISSGFLLTQGQRLRLDSSLKAEAYLRRFSSYLKWLEILESIDLTNDTLRSIVVFFDGTIDSSDSDTLEFEVVEKLELLNYLLRFQMPEVLDMDLIERIIVTIQDKDLLRFPECPKTIEYSLRDRRKRYRNKVFAQHSNMTYDEFVSNRDMLHLLHLTQFDMLRNEKKGDYAEAGLQQAEIKLMQASLSSNVLEKLSIAKESYDSLYARRQKRGDFISEVEHKQWSREKNIRLGRHCEFLAYYTDEINLRISLLEKARKHYIQGRFGRGYLIEYYVIYFSYLHKVVGQRLEEMRAEATKTKFYLEACLRHSHIYPIVNEFYAMFSILSILGIDTMESGSFLLSIIGERVNSKNVDSLGLCSLARLVLANNLLLSLKEGENSFFLSGIKQLIVEGEVSLPIVEEATEELDVEKTHILFSEEVQDMELKGSLHLDVKRLINTGEKMRSDVVTLSLLKTVVGMLNVNGGTIILGVLEAKSMKNNEISSLQELGAVQIKGRVLLGTQLDCDLLNIDLDQLMRHLNDLMRNRIGQSTPSYVQFKPENIYNITILNMTVRPFPGFEGVCLDNSEYYIRVNNETVKISAPEFVRLRLGRASLSAPTP